MKKIVFACIVTLISVTAFADTAYMDTVSRQISWTRPDKAVNAETKQEFKNPSDGTLEACGWVIAEYEPCEFKYRVVSWDPPAVRAMSAAERQAVDDSEAQAQAEAEAQAALYADPAPVVFVPRVDSTLTNVVGESQVFADSATGDLFAVDETGSPEHTLAQKQAQANARKAKVAAAKKAKAKGNGVPALAERVAALEALLGITE